MASIPRQQQIMVATSKYAWQKHNPNKHVIASEQIIQANIFILIIKHIPNPCSFECMTYLSYLIASQHLCIMNGHMNTCSWLVATPLTAQGVPKNILT